MTLGLERSLPEKNSLDFQNRFTVAIAILSPLVTGVSEDAARPESLEVRDGRERNQVLGTLCGSPG